MNSSPKYTLSIGMIVKNEEKYMRRCLDSMKPLLDNISCELVIVDTGSTDKTVEIAREYTDKIYFFDWINNFAAARNFSLQKCTGEWFLYNDADTIFDEDMSEMIEFFNNKELNSKYQSGTYITRNYHDPSHTTYAEHKEHRFARITPELKFVGIIHEVFNCTNANMYHLNTFAHHYGYSFANLAEAQAKSKRNTDLLKIELKNNPNDLRILSLLFDSAIDNEEKAGYLTKALGLAKTSSHVFAPVAYVNAVEYYSKNDKEKAIAYGNEYISRMKNDVTLIDVYYHLGEVYEEQHKFDAAADAFKRCREHQELYKQGKINADMMAYVTIENIGEEKELNSFRHLMFCLANIEGSDVFGEWKKEYRRYSFKNSLGILKNIVLVSMKYSPLADIYDVIRDENNTDKAEAFECFLEDLYYSLKYPGEFVKALSESQSDGDYIRMIKLLAMSDSSQIKAGINSFITDFKWRSGFSEIQYLCIKHSIDNRSILELLNYELMREQISYIYKAHNDLPELIVNNLKVGDYYENIAYVFWLSSLLEAAVFSGNGLGIYSVYFYKVFVSALIIYVTNVYNSALLNDDDVKILPELHRFGYYMALAQNTLDGGDKVGYIRGLKTALVACEFAKDIISSLLDDFMRGI